MKKIILGIILLGTLLCLAGCGSFRVYQFDEIIPPLWDITTQNPYTEKICVTNCSTGETLEYTEGDDHDMIRMRLEGIQAIREKDKGDSSPLYEITFYTTDGTTSISVLSEYDCVIDGYRYEALRSGFDLLYFEALFTE